MNFRTPDVYTGLSSNRLLPMKYVTDANRPTVQYPYNPNGSPGM